MPSRCWVWVMMSSGVPGGLTSRAGSPVARRNTKKVMVTTAQTTNTIWPARARNRAVVDRPSRSDGVG